LRRYGCIIGRKAKKDFCGILRNDVHGVEHFCQQPVAGIKRKGVENAIGSTAALKTVLRGGNISRVSQFATSNLDM
jgi:hypothetical protein